MCIYWRSEKKKKRKKQTNKQTKNKKQNKTKQKQKPFLSYFLKYLIIAKNQLWVVVVVVVLNMMSGYVLINMIKGQIHQW